jgi:outer membrane protein OmpA-like peptidoglycan-associated protein
MLQIMRGKVVCSSAIFSLVMGIVAACGGATPTAEAPLSNEVSTDAPGPELEAPTSEPEVAPGDSAASPQTSTADAAESPAAAPAGGSFVLHTSNSVKDAQGVAPSAIKATATQAALKFVVVDKEKGPISGIVISLADATGNKFYTAETDAKGYAEVLVPIAQKYDLVYLSLGREDVAAAVTVTDEPHQNIRLTLRYKRFNMEAVPRFVLDGVTFDTGKATIKQESYFRLDKVAEYMVHKATARIQISGHTDNVGNPETNKTLSLKRAEACRAYLISAGIDGSRIEALGYGDERPIATNDHEAGRQQNRRIEAIQL